MSIAIGIAFALILGALVLAGFFMVRGGGEGGSKGGHMMRALAVRIAVSVALFALILLAWAFGWIQPAGLPLGR